MYVENIEKAIRDNDFLAFSLGIRQMELDAFLKCGMTPLAYAIACRRWEMVDVILDLNPNLNIVCVSGNTALSVAICYGSIELVRQLVAKGASPNIIRDDREEQSASPLHTAYKYGHEGIVQYLLDQGANIHEVCKGETALHAVCRWGDTDISTIKFLVAAGLDPFVKTKTGNTLLHLACNPTHFKRPKLSMYHVDSVGISVNSINAQGISPLHSACETGSFELVKFLVDRGSNISGEDRRGYTPAKIAERQKFRAIANYLLGHKQKRPSIQSRIPKPHHHIDLFGYVVEPQDPDTSDDSY